LHNEVNEFLNTISNNESRSYVASYTKNISTLYNKWMSLLLYMYKKQENEYILASYRYTILKNTVITDVAF